MNINECFEYLNFWINKKIDAWYTISQLENLIDRGQIAYYTDKRPQYANSNLVKDILSPFKVTYPFTPSNTISGYIVIPSTPEYNDLLDVQIEVDISSRIIYRGVPMVNEDTRAAILSSQVDPVTEASPVAEMMIPRYIKMYPTAGYRGIVTYFKRPVKPVFGYTLVSARRVVYDPDTSTQLEWRDIDHVPILLKALESIGINLRDNEVANFSAMKTAENYQNVNRL